MGGNCGIDLPPSIVIDKLVCVQYIPHLCPNDKCGKFFEALSVTWTDYEPEYGPKYVMENPLKSVYVTAVEFSEHVACVAGLHLGFSGTK